ncbi:MAG: hypothetical protein M1833_002928 [Piccolia ochrophora]|nr:MAG: hypothetical protein M1833_002928 [Piccolia ochrophora]
MDKSLDEVITEHQIGSMTSSTTTTAVGPLTIQIPPSPTHHDLPAARAPASRGPRSRYRERSPPEEDIASTTTKLRVDNLHYDLTQEDLEDLFTRIAPIISLNIRYDRAGRSTGTAYVTYPTLSAAKTAIREFDGANAAGQPIRLSLATVPAPIPQKRSLLDRVTGGPGASLGRRGGRLGYDDNDDDADADVDQREVSPGRPRRSDVSGPPPEGVDRYVPGERQGRRGGAPREGSRRGAGRRDGGARRDGERRGGGGGGRGGDGERRQGGTPRPLKTQEELDAEMEDYWGGGTGAVAKQAGGEGDAATAAANGAAQAEVPVDDIDMIE